MHVSRSEFFNTTLQGREGILLALHCICRIISEKPVSLYENRSIESRQEEAFSIHSQERIMGLLGAMIPHDTNVRATLIDIMDKNCFNF